LCNNYQLIPLPSFGAKGMVRRFPLLQTGTLLERQPELC